MNSSSRDIGIYLFPLCTTHLIYIHFKSDHPSEEKYSFCKYTSFILTIWSPWLSKCTLHLYNGIQFLKSPITCHPHDCHDYQTVFLLRRPEHVSHDNSRLIAAGLSQHISWREQSTFQLQVQLEIIETALEPLSNNTPQDICSLKTYLRSRSILQLYHPQVATAVDVLREKSCSKKQLASGQRARRSGSEKALSQISSHQHAYWWFF